MSEWRRRQMMAVKESEPFIWPNTLQKLSFVYSDYGKYIDTKVLAGSKMLEFDFALGCEYGITSDWNSGSTDKLVCFCGTNHNISIGLYERRIYLGGVSQQFDFPNGLDYDYHNYKISSLGTFTFDNTVIYNGSSTLSNSSDETILIFNRKNVSSNWACNGYFKNFKIMTTLGKALFNGVPVRTLTSWVNAEGTTVPAGTVGFFDTVSKQLFTEYNGGVLVGGPDLLEASQWPSDLQEVEYVSSFGDVNGENDGACIVLPIMCGGKILDFDFSFNNNSDNKGVAGGWGDLSVFRYDNQIYYSAGPVSSNVDPPGGWDFLRHHYYVSGLGVFTYDNTTIVNNPQTASSDTRFIGIFLRVRGSTNGNANGNMYFFKVKLASKNTYIFNGVPARTLSARYNARGELVPAGTVGFYDIEHELFWTSIKSNKPFYAGPDVTN